MESAEGEDDRSSSLGGWESIRDDDDAAGEEEDPAHGPDGGRGRGRRGRIVLELELPRGGLLAAAAGTSLDDPPPSLTTSSHSDGASTQSKDPPSAASTHRRGPSVTDDDDFPPSGASGKRAASQKADGPPPGAVAKHDARPPRVLMPEAPQGTSRDDRPLAPLDPPPFAPAVVRRCIRMPVGIRGHGQPEEVLVLTSVESTVEGILNPERGTAARMRDSDGEDADDISDFGDGSFASSSEEESEDEESDEMEERGEGRTGCRLKAFWPSRRPLYEKQYGIFAAHVYSARVLEKADSNWVTTDEEVAIKAVSWDCVRACREDRLSEDFVKEIAALRHVAEWHRRGEPPGVRGRSSSDTHVLAAETVMWDESSLYIVMPYCPEGDLCQRVAEREGVRFAEDESRFWFKQILKGLETLQAMRICHRDLSPENLIIMDDKSLVIDFGMCLRIPHSHAGRHLIAPRAPCGKLPHMPPELYKRHPFDGHAVDVWSAGTILLFMLTGQRLHNPPLIDGAFDDIDLGISPEAMDLLRKMFRLDPADRLSLEEIKDHPFVGG